MHGKTAPARRGPVRIGRGDGVDFGAQHHYVPSGGGTIT